MLKLVLKFVLDAVTEICQYVEIFSQRSSYYLFPGGDNSGVSAVDIIAATSHSTGRFTDRTFEDYRVDCLVRFDIFAVH